MSNRPPSGAKRLLDRTQDAASRLLQALPGNSSWIRTANHLGLDSHIGISIPRRMIGTIEGIHVSVKHMSHANQRVIAYEVRHRASGPPMRLQRDTALRRVERFFGKGVDIEIGDQAFDEYLVIETAHPELLRNYLTPARRTALVNLFTTNNDCEVRNDGITVYIPSIAVVPNLLTAKVFELVDIAKVMQGHGVDGDAEPLVMEPVIPPGARPSAASTTPTTPTPTRPAPMPTTPTPTPPSPKPPPSQPPSPQPHGLGQQVVIDDLFDGSRARYDAIERFTEEYANKKVHWQGEIERFSTYRHDTDFGDGPGIKAIVVLGAPGRSKLISAEVRAVVQLPPAVALRIGNTIAFSGTLRRVDRFSRQIYLADASVTSR